MKIIAALFLLVSCAASADTIDIFDYQAHMQHQFTGCIWTGDNAQCMSQLDVAHPDPTPSVAGFPELSPMVAIGCFVYQWEQCFQTDVHGLPDGTVYYRLDCPALTRG
jgi:hypothetical protein